MGTIPRFISGVFLVCLLGVFVSPHAASSHPDLPKEHKMGDATFKIAVRDGEVMMEPLLAPSFKLHVFKGEKLAPNTITKCSVWSLTDMVDVKNAIAYTITVLKCGGNEFGVAEVQFAFDEGDKVR